jgi:methylmalonyl-CoA/ethylmalonyl-CoA epimerase
MVFDHIGLAVKSVEKGQEEWKALFGYAAMTEIVFNTRQKVRVAFLAKEGSPVVKLFQPMDAASPLFAFAQRGGGLHHLCFRCEKLADGIAELRSKGARLIVPPAPGEAFENEEIAFLLAGQGINVELIDTARKAGLLDAAPKA